MTGNSDPEIDPRLADSLIAVLRCICETKAMVTEEDRTAIDVGLVRYCEKSEAVALGKTLRALAADIRVVLGLWYSDDGACVHMSERLAEAEKNLVAALDDVRTCLLSCNDKL